MMALVAGVVVPMALSDDGSLYLLEALRVRRTSPLTATIETENYNHSRVGGALGA